MLNFQRFLPRKYQVGTQKLTRELSKHEADYSRTLDSRF
ncbi:positive regulator AgmR [Vibrio cholerae]|nr:positive regulator AgmR [Vibrio cholerae]EGR4151847.1 positive regulator AgmR [Vibrio cholerae]EGR4196135.1 positive regulator AgmR [Vibrio cholerae]KAA1196110.1 positive regulator AgmR [Vibrio cholerae]MVB40755.1 positive regulator AgmR [Vibrio cholerae]